MLIKIKFNLNAINKYILFNYAFSKCTFQQHKAHSQFFTTITLHV